MPLEEDTFTGKAVRIAKKSVVHSQSHSWWFVVWMVWVTLELLGVIDIDAAANVELPPNERLRAFAELLLGVAAAVGTVVTLVARRRDG